MDRCCGICGEHQHRCELGEPPHLCFQCRPIEFCEARLVSPKPGLAAQLVNSFGGYRCARRLLHFGQHALGSIQW